MPPAGGNRVRSVETAPAVRTRCPSGPWIAWRLVSDPPKLFSFTHDIN
jgi:hypothetical protein